ncbi:hypothetical protein Lesp02_44020 [Lentzea sp. NBRC 105346]|uniref:PPE domain-containing protein n=1 Tax=Lentzea sp. NBRC 105346 TaxID=3032205 RepID=UPI0024A01040|nr:PPE domain-containing protein [Lentzea sp. NBRC 105346]GLZ32214.1 hypothetical protein Lesp02_44020 [Lentzea sp. NBRC 105346]
MTQQTTFDENIPVRGFVDSQGNARVVPIDSGAAAERPAKVDPSYLEAPESKPALTDEQNWSEYSHEELYQSIHDKNHPGQVGEISAEWERFCRELTDAAREISEGVTAAEAGWTGSTADGARAGMRQLADWVTRTAETAVKMAGQVQQQGDIMATARASMPEPKNFSYDDAVKTFSGGSIAGLAGSTEDASAARDESTDVRQQAIDVMRTMEQESMALDRTTPAFAPPFNPVTGQVENPAPLMTAQQHSAGGNGDSTSASGYYGGGGYGSTAASSRSAGKFGRGKCDDKASYGPSYKGKYERPDKKSQPCSATTADSKGKSKQRKQIKGDLELNKPGDQRTAAAAARGGAGGGGGGGGFGGGGAFRGGAAGQGGAAPLPATGESLRAATFVPKVGGSFGAGPGGGGIPAAAAGGANAGGAGYGPMAPGAGGHGGQQGQDLERKNKYALSEEIVELLGAELPPAVIGDVAPPKPQKGKS